MDFECDVVESVVCAAVDFTLVFDAFFSADEVEAAAVEAAAELAAVEVAAAEVVAAAELVSFSSESALLLRSIRSPSSTSARYLCANHTAPIVASASEHPPSM